MRTQEFHNKIAELCVTHFMNSLPKTGKPKSTEWTVLSCIVKEENLNFEVVALGTGSKCIGKSAMCPKGTILNDSHAEVICRRSFLRYLYDQMTCEDSILTYNADLEKFCIQSNVDFHFFTSHVPCGDATIFSKQNVEDFGRLLNKSIVSKNKTEFEVKNKESYSATTTVNKNRNDEAFGSALDKDAFSKNIYKNNETHSLAVSSKKRKLDEGTEDIFRTGAKCLKNDARQDTKESGTGYHVLGVVRTKPGRGDPTMSVSCSDKITKWCHLGIQGALLSFLLENPIYLSTFTIAGGTPFNKEALERALYGRLKGAGALDYKTVKMNIGQAKTCFVFCKTEDKLPCSSSIAWIKLKSERLLEIAVDGRKQGVTKKNMYKKSAALKISKLELFKHFCSIVKKFEIKLPSGKNNKDLKYIEAKKISKEYQENLEIMKNHLSAWTTKDSSFLQFCIE